MNGGGGDEDKDEDEEKNDVKDSLIVIFVY